MDCSNVDAVLDAVQLAGLVTGLLSRVSRVPIYGYRKRSRPVIPLVGNGPPKPAAIAYLRTRVTRRRRSQGRTSDQPRKQA